MPSEFDPEWLSKARLHQMAHEKLPVDLHVAGPSDPLAKPMEEDFTKAVLEHSMPHVATSKPDEHIVSEKIHEAISTESTQEEEHHKVENVEEHTEEAHEEKTPEYVQAVERIIEQSQRERDVKEKHRAEKEAIHAKDKETKENHAAAMRA